MRSGCLGVLASIRIAPIFPSFFEEVPLTCDLASSFLDDNNEGACTCPLGGRMREGRKEEGGGGGGGGGTATMQPEES